MVRLSMPRHEAEVVVKGASVSAKVDTEQIKILGGCDIGELCPDLGGLHLRNTCLVDD
jgi:hypothetical protein